MRSPHEPALYLADEDHTALRRIPLVPALTDPPSIEHPPDGGAPLAAEARFLNAADTSVALPGRPAQVLAQDDRVLVTVRDPGLLLIFSVGPDPHELGRVSLPADAWGLAVTADGGAAYVTSAWTHKLSRIDLTARTLTWSVDVAREPRGVTVTADGSRVYVSHLVGANLTRVDVAGEPHVSRVSLPADPLRTLAGDVTVSASLGYATILSPDGRRLFTARHALGARWGWQGNVTVDVLETATDQPIAPVRSGKPYGQLTADDLTQNPFWADHAGVIAQGSSIGVQPRAMVYRAKTKHLLVASEGDAELEELDAMSVAPALIVNRKYRLGGLTPESKTAIQIPPHCGAPTGIALSADEDVAWVYCRSTDNVVAVRLTPDGKRTASEEIRFVAQGEDHARLSPWGAFAYARLAVPVVSEEDALGRRLFYDAEEPVVSGNMGCAGCHPEGRDDGHVWRELTDDGTNHHFIAGPSVAQRGMLEPGKDPIHYGMARQTPMLAGRVNAVGPYGWHAESATLEDRIRAGFGLHRIYSNPTDGATLHRRAGPLAAFLRKGLVPPPREDRELTAVEQQGRTVFASPRTQCTRCHVPASEFTDRSAMPLRGFKAPRFFDEDPQREYKVPSLLFVGGTPPYYHDGSAATLEDLVLHDQDRMGHTSHLTADERTALVAYLKTL